MSKLKFLFLLLTCLLSTQSAFGWDDTGHKIVAYIAWQQMTPQVREKVVTILRSAPEDSQLSVYYLSGSRSDVAKQLDLFMIAATWPDIIRDKNFQVRFNKYNQGLWHYSDTFWQDKNGAVEILPTPTDSGGKAVDQLFAFDKLLRDVSGSDVDKAIALAWFLHLVGDINQPLHCAARVTELEPQADQGGNLFQLTPKDAPRENRLNLHGFWDSIIGINIPRINDACDQDYLPPIAQQIMSAHPFNRMESGLKLGKFDEWQKEGFRIASSKAYPATLLRNQLPSQNYKQLVFQISQERIALAGYRLGAMLNQIFGEKIP